MDRNSSIEFYRIVATFAAFVFHFDGWLVSGMSKSFDVDCLSAFIVFQAIIESCSIPIYLLLAMAGVLFIFVLSFLYEEMLSFLLSEIKWSNKVCY